MNIIRLVSTIFTGVSMLFAGSGRAETNAVSAAEEARLDVNEYFKDATAFTNAAGMVLVKAGSLWVGAHEVTQKAYQTVTGGNPSVHAGDMLPVHHVSWEQAVAFCRQLTEYESEKEMLPKGHRYALPTQAQWERLASGVALHQAVTSSGGSRSAPAPVGSLAPSNDGVYDVRGNVWEWCADPTDQPFRVLRGGSWADWIEINLRLEFRYFARPDEVKPVFGFRCVLIEDPKAGN